MHRVLTAVDEAIVLVEELQRQQREMVRDVGRLAMDPRGVRSNGQIELLRERKDQMDEAVQNLERVLDRSAIVELVSDPTAVMNKAVRRLDKAAELIRESKLVEELQFSRGTIEQWDLPSAVTLELNIETDLQALRDQLEPATEEARAAQRAGALDIEDIPVATETGTLAGIVTSGASGNPLSNVQVSVRGTGLGGLSNNEGRILVLRVPAGEHAVFAQLMGHERIRQTVTVVAGETAVLDLRLFERAVELQSVVVRAIDPDISAAPTSTPFTVAPSILNVEDVQRAMVRAYPRLLRDAGIGGTVRVYFLIDSGGTVRHTSIHRSSGHQALDDAALAVADVYRFSPALNLRFSLLVSLPITFQVR